VHRTPARYYDDIVAQGVIKDILDGYFPYILKAEFPEGVPLKASAEIRFRISMGRTWEEWAVYDFSAHNYETSDVTRTFLPFLTSSQTRVIQIVDRSSETIASAASSDNPRPGGGAGAGGRGPGNIHSFNDIDKGPSGMPESRDRFLSRLPQTVIK
jgi:hypothetical protein